jgi:hypothetical protein
MTPRNTRQFLFAGYTFEQEQLFKIRRAAGQLERDTVEKPTCKAPCVPACCSDCPCVPFEARAKQFTDPLQYLQDKSDQAEPVKVPQYERD